MLNFTPQGLAGRFFGLVAPYLPPPPAEALPPLLWGDESHVRALFGDAVDSLTTTRDTYVERAASPTAYCQLFDATFGPVVAIRTGSEPARVEAFDRDFLEFATEANRSADGRAAEYEYEYLLVVARKRGS